MKEKKEGRIEAIEERRRGEEEAQGERRGRCDV
jgi:hypothetical protein